jgi:hypothetical protein
MENFPSLSVSALESLPTALTVTPERPDPFSSVTLPVRVRICANVCAVPKTKKSRHKNSFLMLLFLIEWLKK